MTPTALTLAAPLAMPPGLRPRAILLIAPLLLGGPAAFAGAGAGTAMGAGAATATATAAAAPASAALPASSPASTSPSAQPMPAAQIRAQLPFLQVAAVPPPPQRARMDERQCPRPEYPMASLRNGESGTTRLEMAVDAQGQVQSSQVTVSSGFKRLDQAAQDALSRCRFFPAKDASGEPVASRVQLEYRWRLDEGFDPWAGVSIAPGALAALPPAPAELPVVGAVALPPEWHPKVLTAIRQSAQRRAGCDRIESAKAHEMPAPRGSLVSPGSLGLGIEMWTLRQCGLLRHYRVESWLGADGRPAFAWEARPNDPAAPPVIALPANADGPAVTEDEVAEAWQRQRLARGPLEYRVRHLMLADKAAADAALARLRAGEDFAALARERSVDNGSNSAGGDLGWSLPSHFTGPFAQAMVDLAPKGRVSTPVQTRFGWHVIELLETRENRLPPLADVHDRIATELQQARKKATTVAPPAPRMPAFMAPPAPPASSASSPR